MRVVLQCIARIWLFAKETYERDDILQKRPIFLRSLLIVANTHKSSMRVVLQYITRIWLFAKET